MGREKCRDRWKGWIDMEDVGEREILRHEACYTGPGVSPKA